MSDPIVPPAEFGAVVVCGGRSTRMGTAKAWLPFGAETMLQRLVRIVQEAISGPIVVVAAAEQSLPSLPKHVLIARDRDEGRGPLEGLRVGLSALRGRCRAAFATGCDTPLLRPAVVRRVCESLSAGSAAVVQTGEFLHPLAAAYRIDDVLPHMDALLAADRCRPTLLLDLVPTRVLRDADLRDVDPALESFQNVNAPADYHRALQLAKLDAPPTG